MITIKFLEFLVTYCMGLVPTLYNVLQAFVRDQSHAVVLISILMGIALGKNISQESERLLETVRGIYETFFKIMG